MCDYLESTFSGIFNSSWSLLNSNFSAALAGALCGALGAHLIAQRSSRRQQLLDEIRSVKATIMLLHGMVNSLFGLKEQLVNPLVENYNAQKKAHVSHADSVKRGLIAPDHPFHYELDFQTIRPIPTPISEIQNRIFRELSLPTARPYAMTTTLILCIDNLRSTLETRNDFIDKMREVNLAHNLRAAKYFGFRDQFGNIDLTYAHCIKAISDHMNDSIFFSIQLADDLWQHGQTLTKRFGRSAPTIHKMDFEKSNKLMPDAKEYQQWLTSFPDS